MPKRSSSSAAAAPAQSAAGTAVPPAGGGSAPAPPQPAARISAISYSLGPDHAFTTSATYRYPEGPLRPVTLRLDPHRYDLLQAAVAGQQGVDAGPATVAAHLHEVYYCLYAPRPRQAPVVAQTGVVPDRT